MSYVINIYLSATVGQPIVIRAYLGPSKNPRLVLHARENDLGRGGELREEQHETRMTLGLTIQTREGSLNVSNHVISDTQCN